MPTFSKKRQFGNIGEDLAEMFLVKSGHSIVERNYLKKWGELDIVSKKEGILRFIEVKSQSRNKPPEDVSRSISQQSFTPLDFKIIFSREADSESDYDSIQNVHYWKQKRMMRAIQTYLLERRIHEDQEWQIDIIAVSVDFLAKTATIRHIENVVFM